VGELEQEYGDRVYFNVISAGETAKRQDEVEAFGFADLKHGMVGFSSDGKNLIRVPGHQFGRERIEAAVKAVLAAG
jgi:hypothetical protein